MKHYIFSFFLMLCGFFTAEYSTTLYKWQAVMGGFAGIGAISTLVIKNENI